MSIPATYDSLTFARRCVAAFFLGQEERLRVELSYAGVPVTVEALRAHGELWSSAFRQDDLSKHDCFVCGSERPPGTLCGCFREVMPTRYFNVNDPMILGQLEAATVVETYVCTCCGGLECVTAGQALRSHMRTKSYVPRKLCEPCFRDSKPRKRMRPRKQHGAAHPPRTHLKEELEARLAAPPIATPITG